MADDLFQLEPLDCYASARSHVFPSKTSMTWFIRRRRTGLIAAGALLMIAGRWFVHPGKFDAYVLEEGSRAAASRSRGLDR